MIKGIPVIYLQVGKSAERNAILRLKFIGLVDKNDVSVVSR